jgi:hypothetical protein
MLHQLGCLLYSPPLDSHIRRLQPIKSGSTWEIELRGASIWCVELIRQQIERRHPESRRKSNTPSKQINGEDHDIITNGHSDVAEAETNGTAAQPPNLDTGSGDVGINAILIDFFLYDTMKQLEREERETIPHHRTRSIWY